jgi:hypothetical protein
VYCVGISAPTWQRSCWSFVYCVGISAPTWQRSYWSFVYCVGISAPTQQRSYWSFDQYHSHVVTIVRFVQIIISSNLSKMTPWTQALQNRFTPAINEHKRHADCRSYRASCSVHSERTIELPPLPCTDKHVQATQWQGSKHFFGFHWLYLALFCCVCSRHFTPVLWVRCTETLLFWSLSVYCIKYYKRTTFQKLARSLGRLIEMAVSEGVTRLDAFPSLYHLRTWPELTWNFVHFRKVLGVQKPRISSQHLREQFDYLCLYCTNTHNVLANGRGFCRFTIKHLIYTHKQFSSII